MHCKLKKAYDVIYTKSCPPAGDLLCLRRCRFNEGDQAQARAQTE